MAGKSLQPPESAPPAVDPAAVTPPAVDPTSGMGNAWQAAQVPPAAEVDPAANSVCGGPYVVQRGDTLWDISRRQSGDPRRWREIYERNRALVGDNPNLIFPGQRLDLCDPAPAVDPATPVVDPATPAVDPATPAVDPATPDQATAPPARTPEEEQALIDAALAGVSGQFETGIFDWAVTDQEGRNALGILNGLDPALQGRAIEQMSQDNFDTMIGEVDTMDAVGFQSLFENTHDPARKLQLWAAYHRGQVAVDAAAQAELTSDDGGWWPFNDTAEQEENARMNDRRDEIVASSNAEVDDEVSFAMTELAAGRLTEADIQDLAQRKQHEHEIEMQYNVNLVNDTGARTDGKKLCWSDSELTQISNAMARMPASHTTHNPMLQEVRRSEMAVRNGVNKPNIGGDHGGGVIRVYDTGVNGNYRHTGDQPEHVDPSVSTQTPLTPLEETIVHEVGHDVHDQNDDAFRRFQAACGWQTGQTNAQLTTAGVSAAQLADLTAGNVSEVEVNGRVYRVDPYLTNADGTPRFVGYDQGSIPTTANGATPNQTGGNDTWEYARTNPKDHFAETYQKAVHMPETLAHDLVDAPAARVATAEASRNILRQDLTDLRAQVPPPSAAELQAAQDALTQSEAQVTDARSDQSAQQTQWDIMRNDIFHGDRATTDAVGRLEARGVPADRVAAFRAQAGRLQTPEQIALLESTFATP